MALEPQPDPALPPGEPDEGFPAAPGEAGGEGHSPWYLAYRRLRRNRVALAFLGLFFLIVVFVLAAPLWASHVAHTGPNTTHTLEKVSVDGEQTRSRQRRRQADRPPVRSAPAAGSSSAPTAASAATRWCG